MEQTPPTGLKRFMEFMEGLHPGIGSELRNVYEPEASFEDPINQTQRSRTTRCGLCRPVQTTSGHPDPCGWSCRWHFQTLRQLADGLCLSSTPAPTGGCERNTIGHLRKGMLAARPLGRHCRSVSGVPLVGRPASFHQAVGEGQIPPHTLSSSMGLTNRP